MTPLAILEFMLDGAQRLPAEFYKHFGLSGQYDMRAAQLDGNVLQLICDEKLCEPNGPFREIAITPSGKDYLTALREAHAHEASERQRLEQEAAMSENRRLAEIARQEKEQQAEAARPKQRAMF